MNSLIENSDNATILPYPFPIEQPTDEATTLPCPPPYEKPASDVTILPYPFPITDSTPSRASKSSERRFRTETSTPCCIFDVPTTIKNVQSAIETLTSNVETALKEGRYHNALLLIENFEESWNKTMKNQLVEYVENQFPFESLQVRPAIELLSNALIKEGKAYFLALLNNRDALAVSEEGFEQLSQALESALKLAEETGFEDQIDPEDLQEVKDSIQAIHDLFSGHLKLAFQMKEEAAADLKAFYAVYERLYAGNGDLSIHFMMKIFEKKLGLQIIPHPMTVDETSAASLFLAGRYEKALEVLNTPEYSCFDLNNCGPMCLAMLGIYDGAINSFPNSDPDKPVFEAAVYFLKGDLDKAKQKALEAGVEGYLMLLAIQGLRN